MKAQIVSFHCVLKNKLGQILGSSFNHEVINQLEHHGEMRLRGLVAKIQNVRQGERRTFTVRAEEAYGMYDPDLVLNIPRSDLMKGERAVIGSEIMRHIEGGASQVYRVVEVRGDMLVLDANHELAGQDLVFDIEVVSARDACSADFEDTSSTTVGGHTLH